MTADELDRVNALLDADLKVFNSDTISRLYSMEDASPEAFPGLRNTADDLRNALISWRRAYRQTVKAGVPDQAAAALVSSGNRLHDSLKAINGAVRKASPSFIRKWANVAGGTVAGVAGDISTGLQAVGKATIAAGQESLVLVKWIPWILAGVVVLYVVGPRLAAAGLEGFNRGRRREKQPA